MRSDMAPGALCTRKRIPAPTQDRRRGAINRRGRHYRTGCQESLVRGRGLIKAEGTRESSLAEVLSSCKLQEAAEFSQRAAVSHGTVATLVASELSVSVVGRTEN
jgi:hypothetical protein